MPKVWHLENFSKALMGGEILRYTLLNSVFYAAVTVVVSTLLASMVAYAINRMYWKAKGIVAAIFSLGIMIPVQATLLPGCSRTGSSGNQRRISGTDASIYYICNFYFNFLYYCEIVLNRGRCDSCESHLPLKFSRVKEKKMANDNHLLSVPCYNRTMLKQDYYNEFF